MKLDGYDPGIFHASSKSLGRRMGQSNNCYFKVQSSNLLAITNFDDPLPNSQRAFPLLWSGEALCLQMLYRLRTCLLAIITSAYGLRRRKKTVFDCTFDYPDA